MKHKGSILDFTHQRNKELMRAFRKTISETDYIDVERISTAVVNSPCSRFWISEERATRIMQSMLKGKPILASMRETKKEMLEEIYRRVVDRMKRLPDASLFEIVISVVNSPAPKFYMRPRCAMEIIYKIKKGFYGR